MNTENYMYSLRIVINILKNVLEDGLAKTVHNNVPDNV